MKRVDPPYGTFTMAADALRQAYGERKGSVFYGIEYTRQHVYNWWMRRANNGFPEKRKDGLLDLNAIVTWYQDYVPDPGGRPVSRAA